MNITLQKITVRELITGYENNDEEGITGYNGLLNIRPKYQRNFVYSSSEQMAVIDTIFKGYPLNVMYWVKNSDNTYELLDGQQRTLSICSYFSGEFFVNINNQLKGYANLTSDEQERFLSYELMIYICTDGTESEKLEWFRIINIAGKELTQQEIRNAIFCGEWVTEMKKKFSKRGCPALLIGKDYIKGEADRQAIMERVLQWISNNKVDEYMALHHHDTTSDTEWQYFQNVINWVKVLFPTIRKEMRYVDWGTLYNNYHNKSFKASELETQIKTLMLDDDVTRKSGIYPYLITGEERNLSIRTFSERLKREAYERQKGICPHCNNHFEFDEMHGDHITPWRAGGRTVAENCQMLCADCNRRKGGI